MAHAGRTNSVADCAARAVRTAQRAVPTSGFGLRVHSRLILPPFFLRLMRFFAAIPVFPNGSDRGAWRQREAQGNRIIALEKPPATSKEDNMFTSREIRDRMTAKPFQPFRICVSDGSAYDIENHDAAMVALNSVEIGVNRDPNGVAERFVRCAFIRITRIEELQAA